MSYKTELYREKWIWTFFPHTFSKTIFNFFLFVLSICHISFWSICQFCRDNLPVVSNYSLPNLLRELITILFCVIDGLQVKSFKSFRNNCFCLFSLILLVSQLSRFCLFGLDCSIDLLVRNLRSVFHSIPWIVFQDLSCYFFFKMCLHIFQWLWSFKTG